MTNLIFFVIIYFSLGAITSLIFGTVPFIASIINYMISFTIANLLTGRSNKDLMSSTFIFCVLYMLFNWLFSK